MKIESIRLKNFKAFEDAELTDLPNFCVVVGANGTGKSTIFSMFGFLHLGAVKGLAQFARFPAVMALGNLIENWHVSDFHISKARPEKEAGYAEHLSREGENLLSIRKQLKRDESC